MEMRVLFRLLTFIFWPLQILSTNFNLAHISKTKVTALDSHLIGFLPAAAVNCDASVL